MVYASSMGRCLHVLSPWGNEAYDGDVSHGKCRTGIDMHIDFQFDFDVVESEIRA